MPQASVPEFEKNLRLRHFKNVTYEKDTRSFKLFFVIIPVRLIWQMYAKSFTQTNSLRSVYGTNPSLEIRKRYLCVYVFYQMSF